MDIPQTKWCLAAISCLLASYSWAQNIDTPTPTPSARPRVGLVLSGGGARGLAHVGVLKALEREHVQIDCIAGTSMGAIIGGLYAAGLSANDIERELLTLHWDKIFASRVDRQQLPFRRKEEDFAVPNSLEMGLRDGEFRTPAATLSSRGLEYLLRRLTLPVQGITDFDKLPTPFRAIATDMESGEQVILRDGDLAQAMRSSMSVPGVFSPLDWKPDSAQERSRILGDGGLVNNVPIDVARAMCADVTIAVNVGTKPGGRETLNSIVGVTVQMINLLTEQNVQRSLATLQAQDLLITPELNKLTSGDFDRTKDFIALGEAAAEQVSKRLAALSSSAQAHAQWSLLRTAGPSQTPRITAIRIDGAHYSKPDRFISELESKPGDIFDPLVVARDIRRLAAHDDYVRQDYHLEPTTEGNTLVYVIQEKPWGPNYFHIGLDLATDFAGNSNFNVKILHNRHWLTETGGEWRNLVQIGQDPRWASELYHPLNFSSEFTHDWFASASTDIGYRVVDIYDNSTLEGLARVGTRHTRLGLALGKQFGSYGELRLGLNTAAWRNNPQLTVPNYGGPSDAQTWRQTGVHVRAALDQLDFADFPQRGVRATLNMNYGQLVGTSSESVGQVEFDAVAARSLDSYTLKIQTNLMVSNQSTATGVPLYSLGGFNRMAGYRPGQIAGNALLYGSLNLYHRLRENPVLTRGMFVGGSIEIGNAWDRYRDMTFNLRQSYSVYLGADTGLGPLYLGVGYAPRGSAGVYLSIGRP